MKSVLTLLVLVVSCSTLSHAAAVVGDLNADGGVDLRDLDILAQHWLSPDCNGPDCEADIDNTDGVNEFDFAVLATNWGIEPPSLLITEFLASNASSEPLGKGELLDEDGDSSDWIEIFNSSVQPIDVSGWRLTNNAGNLSQWRFPTGVILEPGAFLVVFASGKNRAVAGQELHTNFSLNADGEYLAIVKPDGKIAHDFAPAYPRQLTDISYGLAQYATTFVPAGANISYHIPTAGDLGMDWTTPGFDDSTWRTGTTGIGFGNSTQGFDVVYYKAGTTVSGLDVAESVIANESLQSSTASETAPFIDYFNTGGTGNFGNNNPFPSTTVGQDVEDFVVLVTARVLIPQAGLWTFGVNSDDGFSLELTDTTNTYTMSYPDPRGPADTLATFDFPSWGFYKLRLVFYEQGGGSELELFVAQGNHGSFNPGSFRLVGDFAGGGLYVVSTGSDLNTDIQDMMQDKNASVWTRIRFYADDPDFFTSMVLRMRYDDAFVAYLNGNEVARANFTGTPGWNSIADSNRPDDLSAEFTAFDLSSYLIDIQDGTNVLAIQGLNEAKNNGSFMMLPELAAASSQTKMQYFAGATPGEYNSAGTLNLVSDTQFSHNRGFYDSPFNVTIATETPGTTIHYTLDGSAPSETNGFEYVAPIPISTTTCLRAIAFKTGWVSSNIDTQTYIFLDNVVQQKNNPSGFPTSWGGTAADYEMDPDIVNNSQYRNQMRASLLSLPTLSLVTDVADMFGPSGIYTNSNGEGVAWERPSSVEWINPDGTTGFHVDAGLRIYGGAFRGMGLTRKKSFRLLFKRAYGPTKLNFRVFEEEDAATSFDTITLRGGANDGWNNYGRENTQYIVDEFMRRTQLALGQPSCHGTFVHLYINGLYWGLYNATERPQSSFCANYFGGDKAEWDTVNAGEAIGESSGATWNAMFSQVRSGLSDMVSYQMIQGNDLDGVRNPEYDDLLDMDNYIDYMFSNFWGGTGDWPHHNYYAGCRRPPNSTGFKFFNWDAEGAIVIWSSLGADVTGVNQGAGQPYSILRHNDEFQLLFGDHAYRHLFNDGPAAAQASYDRYKKLSDQVELAIIAESARWGDQASTTPYTQAHWRNTRDYILNTYMPQRSAVVLSQLRTAAIYPEVNAPIFVVNGTTSSTGHFPTGSTLMIGASSGRRYYTLDGSDPRVPIYLSTSGKTVTLVSEDSTKRIHIPTVKVEPSKGTVLAEYWFGIGGTSVTDLTSNSDFPGSPGQSEYLTSFEMPTDWNDNYGTRVTGHLHPPHTGNYTFWIASDDGSELWLSTGESPGNKTLIANVPGWTPSRQWNNYPEQKSKAIPLVAGKKYYIEALQKEGGGGDNLAVAWEGPGMAQQVIDGQYLSPAGIGWITSDFDDSSWTAATGGVGYERNPADPVNFSSLIQFDMAGLMYNTNSACYIRIPFNVLNKDISSMTLKIRYDDGFVAYVNGAEIARRNFSDDIHWNSAADSERADQQAVVFEEIDVSKHAKSLRNGQNVLAICGLNSSSTSNDFLVSVELVAKEMSQGDPSPQASEYINPMTLTHSIRIKTRAFDGTWSALNEAAFAVGPVAENLRVTEMMYHPLDVDPNAPGEPNEEYIELQNIGSQSINLNLVRFTNGVDFMFGDTSLAAGQRILVVEDIAAFEARYGAGLNVAGSYTGKLANNGERITLQDAAGEVIQSFRYKDGWRGVVDGDGYSLTIIDPANSDPNSWSEKEAWRASAYQGGSPGSDDSGILPNPGAVVINEVLAHSHNDASDWIELYNTTDGQIDIGGWFLSDSASNLKKYKIAAGTKIPAHGYKVFYQNFNFGAGAIDPGRLEAFALSENGETVYLSSAIGGVLTGYRESESFGASETWVSFGRYYKQSTNNYNFVLMSEPTDGRANAYPKVGPIVISEIMYNPDWPANGWHTNDQYEYIELRNTSSIDQSLYRYDKSEPWKFTEGVKFVFPDSPGEVIVPAGGCIVIARNPEAFMWRYPSVPTELVYGPYEGGMGNDGERIELSLPGDIDRYAVRQYVRVDRVVYSDGSHPQDQPGNVDLWHMAPDGYGYSLHRISDSLYGNDPNNWQAAAPSPGQ